jgi:hypothetical protein
VVDLQAVLENTRRLLRPGGCLIASEYFRQRPAKFLHIEFFPITLHGYNKAKIVPGYRETRGYITLAEWRNALTNAGFPRQIFSPDPADQPEWPIGGFVAFVD